MEMEQKYQQWIKSADASLQAALRQMNAEEKEDAFYRDLAFGTGGLRGVIGPGTNRMNLHTVSKASQGLADYVIAHFPLWMPCCDDDIRHRNQRKSSQA